MNLLLSIVRDLPSHFGGSTGGRIIELLVFGTVAAVAYRLPRTAPYLAVFGVATQSNATHTLTSDGDVLLGLCVGLALGRIRSRQWVSRARISGTLVTLGLLNLVVFLSYVVNSRGPNGAQIALATEYIVSRSLLASMVVLLSDDAPDWQWRWARAIGFLAIGLSVFRLSEVIGLPLKSATDILQIRVLGDLTDPSNANLYAVVLGIGIPMVLAGFGRDRVRVPAGQSLRWILAAIVTLAMASAASRTGAVIIAIVVAALFVSANYSALRIAVGALALVYVVGSFIPASSILQKPVVIASGRVPNHTVATNQSPIVAPSQTLVGQPSPPAVQYRALPPMRPQWRAVLDQTSYRLKQTLPSPPTVGTGHYVAFSGAAGGGGAGVTLLISVNGTLVAQLKPSDMTTDYRWHEVQIPDPLVTPGKPVTIEIMVTGTPDSVRDYFLVGGINARSSGYSSRIWTGESWSEGDLSSDPGTQTGLFMVFVDGVIPPLEYFTKSSDAVIDTSIEDRLTLWRTSLNVFLHNPLLGTGFYTFGLVRSRYTPQGSTTFYPYANAHSNYFQLLADVGVAGPLLFALIFVVPLVRLARATFSSPPRMRWLPLAYALAFVSCLISSVSETWIADSRFYVLSWMLALVGGGASWTAQNMRELNAIDSEVPSDTVARASDPSPSRPTQL